MGVFDELPVNGDSRSAQQLSDALGVEKQLLGKMPKNHPIAFNFSYSLLPVFIWRRRQADILPWQVRLMRIVTAIGPFAEVGKEEYAHTDLSRAYLDPGLRGFFAMA